jgi:hypothetical protein
MICINFFDIVYAIEEQIDYIMCTKPKQTNILSFFCEYILVKLILQSYFMNVW